MTYSFTAEREAVMREKLKESFELFDVDKSGYIDYAEHEKIVHQANRSVGAEVDLKEFADSLFKKIDADGDQKISLEEFADVFVNEFKKSNPPKAPYCMPAEEEAFHRAHLKAAFEAFDEDKSGYVDYAEHEKLVYEYNRTNSTQVDLKEVAESLFKQADADGNQKISLEEFTNFVLNGIKKLYQKVHDQRREGDPWNRQ